jgi:hypothetical protein
VRLFTTSLTFAFLVDAFRMSLEVQYFTLAVQHVLTCFSLSSGSSAFTEILAAEAASGTKMLRKSLISNMRGHIVGSHTAIL